MAGRAVRRINNKFYLVIDEVGGSSGIESETESVELASPKDPQNPGGTDENISQNGESNVDAETQHIMCSAAINDIGGEIENGEKIVKCKENSFINIDNSWTNNIQMTENSKSSDVESENLESVNMETDNGSDESESVREDVVPIIKISFRDEEVEKSYKSLFMKFLTQKIHHCTILTSNKNKLELEIFKNQSETMLDFHLDTTPGCDIPSNKIPSYGKSHEVLLNDSISFQKTTPDINILSPMCFNCNGNHLLRDCPKQKDMEKIIYNRNKYKLANKTPKNSRYHLDENQRFGNVMPGVLSKKLRNALDLKKDQQPLFIYRMRLLGYPPAWLEEARVSHSGVVVYDSNGQPITEEEEGEITDNAKDRYDISRIIEFPGFNVPLPKNMKEEGNVHGCPAMSEQQSKENLIKKLEPNAVQAYRKRSLTLPKCSPQDTISTNKNGKRLPSPTIEEMEEKKRLLLLELDNEDDNGKYKPNQNPAEEAGFSEIQSDTNDDGTKVKNMDFGTPVLKSISHYSKLPSREQFSVNVSEVINFENLPNSTGKYESMSNLILKIRDTVTRIQNEEHS